MIEFVAALVTIVSGFITIGIFISERSRYANRVENSSKTLSFIGLLALGSLIVAALYLSYTAIANYYAPKWTEWHFVEMPKTEREGRTVNYSVEAKIPNKAHVIKVNCDYSWQGWDSPIVKEIDEASGLVKCKGGHRKHDVGRTLMLQVCYSRWSKTASCPEAPKFLAGDIQ